MNKEELVQEVSKKTKVTQKDTAAIVNELMLTIEKNVAKGKKVTLVGFGTFEVRDRKEKQVLNPQTKQMMTAPASKAPAFKAGQALKSAVNK